MMRILAFFGAICLQFICTAQPCHTIAAGDLLDPANWSCDCNVSICDTLLIHHALTLDGTLNLPSARYTEITEGGSLTGSGSLRLAGSLVNRGTLALYRLATDVDPFPEFDTYFLNVGNIENNILLLLSDSTSNQGTISCDDSLIVGFQRKLRNDSDIFTNILFQFGDLYNYENLISDSLLSFRSTVNHGTILCINKLEIYSRLFNFGDINTHQFEVISAGVDNYGTINVNSSSTLGTMGGIQFEQSTTGRLNTRNLYVLEDTDVRGQGSICILEHAENHGNIIGSMQLCDLTPTLTVPPFWDVHTGTIVLTPTYCGPIACATVQVDEMTGEEGARIQPNPTVGPIRITHSDALRPVHGWMVMDGHGRLVQRSAQAPDNTLELDLSAYRSGTYWVLLMDQAGAVMERLPVVVEK
ncbi:MAG: T9SS type A sorting domain-containing protein [Flavobacteriales bacterium]|jgi:hypothetical protein|nr:T9SS type A sorting domain-containing protein [Flavobacteriales bacterium]